MRLLHLCQGQTDGRGAEAHFCHSRLDGNGIDFGKQCLDQGQILALQRGSTLDVTLPEQLADLLGLAGQDVGKHRNAAQAAHRKHRHDLVVVAGINIHLVTHKRGSLKDEKGNVYELKGESKKIEKVFMNKWQQLNDVGLSSAERKEMNLSYEDYLKLKYAKYKGFIDMVSDMIKNGKIYYSK